MSLKNYVFNPFSKTYNTYIKYETFVIPNSSPYIVQLADMPEYNATSTISVKYLSNMSSFTEKYSAPNVAEFQVDYFPDDDISDISDREGTGKILFNSSDAGKTVFIKYEALGSIDLKETLSKEFDNYTIELFQGVTVQRFLAGIFSNEVLYLAEWDSSTTLFGISCALSPNASSFASRQTIANSSMPFSDPQMNGRHIFAQDSTGRATFFYTGTTPASRVQKTNIALNTSDLGGYTSITSSYYFQYTSAVQVKDFMYFFGASSTFNVPSNLLIKYDLINETFTVLTSLPQIWQYGCAVFDNSNTIYLLGNRDSANYNTCFKYEIESNLFTQINTLTTLPQNGLFMNNAGFYNEKNNTIELIYCKNENRVYANLYVYNINTGTYTEKQIVDGNRTSAGAYFYGVLAPLYSSYSKFYSGFNYKNSIGIIQQDGATGNHYFLKNIKR